MKVIPGRKKGLGFFLQLFVVYFLTSSYHLLAMKKKLIVGEFNESYPPSMDGVGEIVYDYVHELRTMGDECYAVVAGDKHAAAYDAANDDRGVLRSIMHVIPMISPYGYTKIRKEVKDKVASLDFDIVHAHSPFMMGRYAIKTARKKNIPVVMTFHSQFKKDKAAKRDAEGELFHISIGPLFIHDAECTPMRLQERRLFWKAIIECEKCLLEADPSALKTEYDYEECGENDYIARNKVFTAVFSPKGGAVAELCYNPLAINLLDTRVPFDKSFPHYQ